MKSRFASSSFIGLFFLTVLLFLAFLALLLVPSDSLKLHNLPEPISGPKFPKGFKWGTATAAYQVEGSYNKDGRGLSIWDVFSHTPGKIRDGTSGDAADDHYNRLEEDVELMKELGVQLYRFSISWPRIFPNGEGTINQKGIDFYNKLINTLLKKGIQPFVTLYHWDLPQALDEKYEGWMSATTADKFVDYAEVCFREFGDRVKFWLTFNEPHSFAVHGHVTGWHAPGRCSNRFICSKGNTSTEAYIVTHNVLLAHAKAVDLYRKKFFPTQQGKIGITLDLSSFEPFDPKNPLDIQAVERAATWHAAWFADPVYFGDYPQIMKERVGSRLPSFTEEEKKLLKGSSDFFGLNHYTTSYAIHVEEPEGEGYYRDRGCLTTAERDGKLIGPRGEPDWLYVVPRGMRWVLNWVWKRYKNPDIFITENGVSVPHESFLPLKVALEDDFRLNYYKDYIEEMAKAINEDGVRVLGYMAWSLLDNFEWADGYEKRFGLVYVDFKDQLKRYHKKSALWYRDWIALNS
jgi:beta-glucosidase